ncbi:MAG: zinc ribbon domain-containing protein [Acidobacteriota bacterium]|nr:zinc ribbon domain-containing protein [Acidobacteriota bacterium]
MFCPQCGTNQSDELKFCKSCGANLYAVRQVVATRETDEKFDWSKTWVAEMFMSGEEANRRKAELERLQGITPEVKRYDEIKAGVITGCVGIGVMIFLYVLAEGIILGGKVPPHVIEIIRRIWVAGVIPLMVGIGLLINGLLVSRKLVEIAKRQSQMKPDVLEKGTPQHTLRPADTAEFIPSEFSITEGTTKHLRSSGPKA